MSTNTDTLVLGPFDDLAEAQKAAQDARASSPGQPITVTIAEGEYFVDQTLRFGPDDSGAPGAPVTFKAQGAVRLTGALAPETCVPLKEADIPHDVKRAVPEPSQNRVVVLDIPRINPDVSIPSPSAWPQGMALWASHPTFSSPLKSSPMTSRPTWPAIRGLAAKTG